MPIVSGRTRNVTRSLATRSKVRRVFKAPRTAAAGSVGPIQSVSRPELLVAGLDREFSRLVLGIFTLRSMLQAIREKNGLTIGLGGLEYIALMTLVRVSSTQDIGVQELAGLLRLSGAFVTSTVNRLVEMGLVTKSPHPVDGRRICLRPTEQAVELLSELGPMQRQVNDVAFGSLTAAEFHQLCDLVQRVLESTERAMALQDYLMKAEGQGEGKSPKSGRRRAAQSALRMSE